LTACFTVSEILILPKIHSFPCLPTMPLALVCRGFFWKKASLGDVGEMGVFGGDLGCECLCA
jgi:hypothetical protein